MTQYMLYVVWPDLDGNKSNYPIMTNRLRNLGYTFIYQKNPNPPNSYSFYLGPLNKNDLESMIEYIKSMGLIGIDNDVTLTWYEVKNKNG